tara:strand:+ start:804 stop:1037 length:234 start_codon:yes stop_codon:yes gene_type:complete
VAAAQAAPVEAAEAQAELLLDSVAPEVLEAAAAEVYQPHLTGVETVAFLVAAAPMVIKLMLAMADAEAEAGVAVAHP